MDTTTTCLTAVILLLAALSTTTVGQSETTTPDVTTTATTMQHAPNDLLGTSSEESLLNEQSTTVVPVDKMNGESSTLSQSPQSGVGTPSSNAIFGTENEKLNDIEADKLTKADVHAAPESAVSTGVLALTRNDTTTTAPAQAVTTEAERTSANAFVTTQSTEGGTPFHTGEASTSSQDSDDGATSASSMVPVTSGTSSQEVTTLPYGYEGATQPSVDADATAFAETNVPNALQQTSSPEAFPTQQAYSTPFSSYSTDALPVSSSFPGSYGPSATEGELGLPSDGNYGAYPNYQAGLSSAAVASDKAAAGPLSGYSDQLGTNVPSDFSAIGPNTGIFSGRGLGFRQSQYSTPEVNTQVPSFFRNTGRKYPWGNILASGQGQGHDAASTPPTDTAANEFQASDSTTVLPSSAGEGTTEENTSDVPLTTTEYLYAADAASTESPTHYESTTLQHQSDQTSTTEKPHDETSPSTQTTSAAASHDGEPDAPATESSVTTELSGNRAKMGRARTMDDTTDPANNYVDETVKEAPEPTHYIPPSETEENAQQGSISTSEPVVTTTSKSESVPSVTTTDEPTTVSSMETASSTDKTEPATAVTASADIAETTVVDATQVSSESTTESPILSTMTTPVVTTTSKTTSASLAETTATHSVSPYEGTSSETTDSSTSHEQAETTTSLPEQATSRSVTDTTTDKVTDPASTTPIDSSTQGVTQSQGESGFSDGPSIGDSGDSSTQSPDIVSSTQEGTEAVPSEAPTTESPTTPSATTARMETSTGEASTSVYPELMTSGDSATAAPDITEHPMEESTQQTETSSSVSVTTDVAQPGGKEELTTGGMDNVEQTTSVPSKDVTTALTTEQVAITSSEQPQTTKLTTYEATTTPSSAVSSEGSESTPEVNAAATPTTLYRSDEFTTAAAETTTAVKLHYTMPASETTSPTAETTTKQTTETTASVAETVPPSSVETAAPPGTETTAQVAESTTPFPEIAETAAPPGAETTAQVAETTTPFPEIAETAAPPGAETTAQVAESTTPFPEIAETAASPGAETTAQVAESTTPFREIATHAADTTTQTVQTATAVKTEEETTPAAEVTASSSAYDAATGAVSEVTTTTPAETTTMPNTQTTEPPVDVGAETEGTGFSLASRSPKQLSESTSASLPDWSTLPSAEHDHKHSFTTAPDLFSTTQSYTSSEATTTHAPSSVEPAGREITEGAPWNADTTTASTTQDWTSSTQAPVYTSGSPASTETVDGDKSCNIVEGSLPVSCLLPEELNHTVTVKFGDLNRTRAETFRAEARVWLMDYCSKNGIPLGDPSVVFLSGDRGMDLISFFVVNRTRGSVVPSDTVVAVLNNMKLTFEDKLGTAITDVFYGLPVLHKKDVGVAGFLGSSLGLVYVIVGAAVAALLLLALLVVIMVKCRTLSSNQYSPDSEKLTKDLHMRAEMGDLRPAEEILKEEAQLKDAVNGNGTHINGDGWVVPYSQIVNERKPPADAQDTRL